MQRSDAESAEGSARTGDEGCHNAGVKVDVNEIILH
jgi:hypothetical protein